LSSKSFIPPGEVLAVARSSHSQDPLRAFLTLSTLILVMGILYFAHKVLIPLALAILLTFILSPLVEWMYRKGSPRIVAVVVVGLVAFTVLGAVAWITTTEVQELAVKLPEHSQIVSDKLLKLRGDGEGVVSRLEQMVQEISRQLRQTNSDQDGGAQEPMSVVVQNEGLLNYSWLQSIAGSLAELLASLVLVIMLVVFMLFQHADLRYRFIRLIGHSHLTMTTKALDEAGGRISRFLILQLVTNVCFGILLSLGLMWIGVPYAVLWGFLAALLRFVPYVGTWLALVFPLTLSFAVFPGWLQLLEVFGLFLVLELLTANVLEPLLFGHGTGISPVALLLSAAFWAWLWGPIGLVLSTPLTVCLAVLGRYVPQLRFFDVLLSSEATPDPVVHYYQRLLAQDHDEATDIVEEHQKTRPADSVYDRILLPALVLAGRDRERGELSPEDESFICRATQQIVEDVQEELSLAGEDEPGGAKVAAAPDVFVLGCPAREGIDELALHMFRGLLERSGCQLKAISAQMLAAEIVSMISSENPPLVVIAAVPPGGLVQTRYLCKRLRSHFPDLKILVGRWGEQEATEHARARLRSAGADFVATTLLESRDQVIPLVRIAETTIPTTGEKREAVSV
jgi:predicted PurR-regulated permease PerM